MNARLTIQDWIKRAPKPVADGFDPELHATPADLLDLAQEELNRAEEGLVRHHPNTMKALRRFADELHAAGVLEESNGPEPGEDDGEEDRDDPGEDAPDEVAQAGVSEDEDDGARLGIGEADDNAPDAISENVSATATDSTEDNGAGDGDGVAAGATETDAAKEEEAHRRARAAAFRKQVRQRLKAGFPNTLLREDASSGAVLRPLNRKFTKWANRAGEEIALSLEAVLERIGADARATESQFEESFVVEAAA